MKYCKEASNVLSNDSVSYEEKWAVFQLICNIVSDNIKRRHFKNKSHLLFQISCFQQIRRNLNNFSNQNEEQGRKYVVSKYISNISFAISKLKDMANNVENFQQKTRSSRKSAKTFQERKSEENRNKEEVKEEVKEQEELKEVKE